MLGTLRRDELENLEAMLGGGPVHDCGHLIIVAHLLRFWHDLVSRCLELRLARGREIHAFSVGFVSGDRTVIHDGRDRLGRRAVRRHRDRGNKADER